MTDEQSRSVARLLAVFEQLSVAPQPLSNLELARVIKAPPSSTHRLLAKLCALGYIERDPRTHSYSITPLLSGLGGRLADASGHSPALRALMQGLRVQSGGTVSVWVQSGVHVRLIAMLVGKRRGSASHAPGEMREPFSTPGLALASTYSKDEIGRLLSAARRHRIPLGRHFRTLREVLVAVAQVAERGYAVGFNLRSDGWGALAWPVPLSRLPVRYGAMAMGLPVGELRQRQGEIVTTASRLLQAYRREIGLV